MQLITLVQEKYSQLSLAAKAALWFTFCNFILKGINFISTPIFAALLEPREYGILSVFMSYEQIILILATWEIPLSAYQKGLQIYKQEVPYFTKSSILLSNTVTAVFFIFAFLFYRRINNFTGFSVINLLLLFIYMILQPAYNCWLILKRTRFEYKKAVLLTISNAIISVLFPLIAVFCINRTANVKFNYTLIGSSFVFLIFYVKSIGKTERQNIVGVFGYWKYIARFQIPLVIHSLSYTVLAQADRIMISKMVGDSEAAYYSVAYNIAQVVGIVQASLMQALIPWILDKLEKQDYRSTRDTTKPLLIFIGIVVIMFVFVSPEAIKLLFSPDYYEAIWSLPPISISVYFMFLNSLFVWVENYYEKTHYVAIASVVCAVLNVIMNYFAIQHFGYIACGYTTLISYIMFALLHYFFVIKICRDFMVAEKIYDLRSNFYISSTLLILMIIAVFTYQSVIIRYMIFAIALALVIMFRDKIISSILKIKQKT